LYSPALSVTAIRTFSMSAGLLASTFTPGNTLPVVSFTLPEIPAVPCAAAAAGKVRHNTVRSEKILDIALLLRGVIPRMIDS
jgi:hypothetical protein